MEEKDKNAISLVYHCPECATDRVFVFHAHYLNKKFEQVMKLKCIRCSHIIMLKSVEEAN